MTRPDSELPNDVLERAARAPRLAVVTDLDGTLVPFASDPAEAAPGPETLALLGALAEQPETLLVVATGRPRDDSEAFFRAAPGILLVAEHGLWTREGGAWRALDVERPATLDALGDDLERLTVAVPDTILERKTAGLAFHYRRVAPGDKEAVLVLATSLVDKALALEPRLEKVDGEEVLEVRMTGVNKGRAIALVRERLGADAAIVALGDDTTDEDMFAALGTGDVGIRVGADDRPTSAALRTPDPAAAHQVLRWLLATRRGAPERAPLPPLLPYADKAQFELLVISNRLPELRTAADPRKRNVGGLVSALEPVLARGGGAWLGWSGRTSPAGTKPRRGLQKHGDAVVAWVDLPEDLLKPYYNGYCNGSLWPLLHSFPWNVRFAPGGWEAYVAVNEEFAESAARIAAPGGTVWLHDYHLLLAGEALRRRGHHGPIGLFLHVPFCGKDLFFVQPQAERILDALLELDLVGFHTADYADNFLRCAATRPGARIEGDVVRRGDRRTRVGVFPIGILPHAFERAAAGPPAREVEGLLRDLGPARLVLGVDRLDYTKGIPERLEGFGRLLAAEPELRGRVSLVQVSVPSRADVPEYAEQRARVEGIVGRINGEYGAAGWVPIRYLYRSYGVDVLAQLYRAAHVGYVTPLRDGMNLVAKEYVAAQDPADPGVLVLSRFAGAAAELSDAILTNPYDAGVLGADLARALRMTREERLARHASLRAAVARSTALTWAEDFLAALRG